MRTPEPPAPPALTDDTSLPPPRPIVEPPELDLEEERKMVDIMTEEVISADDTEPSEAQHLSHLLFKPAAAKQPPKRSANTSTAGEAGMCLGVSGWVKVTFTPGNM